MPREYKSWPRHAEEIARSNEAAAQKSIKEWGEHKEERQLLASNEADRIKIAAAEEERVEAMKARAARKASPARIQSRD